MMLWISEVLRDAPISGPWVVRGGAATAAVVGAGRANTAMLPLGSVGRVKLGKLARTERPPEGRAACVLVGELIGVGAAATIALRATLEGSGAERPTEALAPNSDPLASPPAPLTRVAQPMAGSPGIPLPRGASSPPRPRARS